MHKHETFFLCLWQLCPSESWAWRWYSCLACRDTNCLRSRSYGPTEFFRASYTWRWEGLFGQSFSVAPPVQALRGILCQGSFCVARYIRHIEGLPPPRRSAHQALKGARWVGSYSVVQSVRRLMVSLYSAAGAGVWRERGYGDGSTPYVWLSSIALLPWLPAFPPAISHHDLLPRIPSLGLSAVNRSPHLGIAPQSLNSSSQPLPLPGDLHFCLAYVWLQQVLSDSHSI